MPADSFLYDTFTEGSTTTLSSHTPDIGGAWSISGGSGFAAIVGGSGAAVGASTLYNVRYSNSAFVPADFYLEASFRLTTSSATARFLFRGVDASNFYYVFTQPTGFGFSKWVAGSPTSMGGVTTTLALNTDYTLRLQVRGSELSATVVQVAKTIDVTDTTYPSAGYCGLWFPSGRETVDYLDVRQLPARFLYDTFSEAVDTPLASHIPEVGAAWSYFSTPTINVIAAEGRTAGSDASNGSVAFNFVKVADANVSATLTRNNTPGTNALGLVGRLQTTGDNRYATLIDTVQQLTLTKRVGGTNTTLGSVAVGFAQSTDRIEELRISGSTLTVLWNGSAVIGPLTDTSITGPGYWGFVQRANGRVDNVEAWTTATAYGAVGTTSTSGPSGSAIGAAFTSSSLDTLNLNRVTGSAVGAASASGSIPSAILSALGGTGSGAASVSAVMPALNTSTPTGSASGAAQISGSIPALSLSSLTGFGSGAALASGSLASILLGEIAGQAFSIGADADLVLKLRGRGALKLGGREGLKLSRRGRLTLR